MVGRAVVRSGLPVRYSQGFNPRPRLVLPLPRTVGMASLDEWLLIQLAEPSDPARICRVLAEQLPTDLRIRGCWLTEPSGSWQAEQVDYEVPLGEDVPQDLAERVCGLMIAPSVTVHRDQGPRKPAKVVEARGFIAGVDVLPDRLQMRLLLREGATVRPVEVLGLLHVPAEPYASRIVRVAVRWRCQRLLQGHVFIECSHLLEEGR